MIEVRPLRAYAEVSLGRQRAPVHDTGPHVVPYLRAANVKDGSLDLIDVKEMNFDPKEQEVFALKPGDVLVTEGSGSLRAVGAASVWSGELPGIVCFQNTLLRLRPRPSTDPRFLAWWCRYAFGDGLFASIATGANIFHISADRVRALPMTYLAPEQQRAIADYLDTETARIDALIAKKRRMIDLLGERLAHLRSQLLNDTPGWPLKRLLAAPMAYGVLVPRFVEPGTGVPMLRITNLDMRGDVRLGDVRWVDDAQGVEFGRTRVSPGDLVLSVVGSMGRAAVVPSTASGFNLNRPLARLQPRHDLPSRLLWHWTQTASFQDQARIATGSGAAQPTLNLGDLANFRVGLPLDPQLWSDLLLRLENGTARADAAADALSRQIGLLIERRQALITAAVTGEVGIPGVAA